MQESEIKKCCNNCEHYIPAREDNPSVVGENGILLISMGSRPEGCCGYSSYHLPRPPLPERICPRWVPDEETYNLLNDIEETPGVLRRR